MVWASTGVVAGAGVGADAGVGVGVAAGPELTESSRASNDGVLIASGVRVARRARRRSTPGSRAGRMSSAACRATGAGEVSGPGTGLALALGRPLGRAP